MSEKSSIQWCTSTLNPAMGCDGCELFPTISQLTRIATDFLSATGIAETEKVHQTIEFQMGSRTPSEVYHSRQAIAQAILRVAHQSRAVSKLPIAALARAMADEFRCYAAILHLRHGKDPNKPGKHTNRGYAPYFEQVTKFPGRMAAAANWKDLKGLNDPAKPWLDGCRRLIFLSDMGDLLSKSIDFEYLRDEVLAHVDSPAGRRHIWLWLTKRPQRMAKFSAWLEAQGLSWPDHLVAMTSVTSFKTTGRVEALKRVRCHFRGLSVEPLWSAVYLPLEGIDWVIVGGESGAGAKPFELAWAREIRRQCQNTGAAFFLKQLGARPVDYGIPLALKDKHGGDWAEWPRDLRVREVPAVFRD